MCAGGFCCYFGAVKGDGELLESGAQGDYAGFAGEACGGDGELGLGRSFLDAKLVVEVGERAGVAVVRKGDDDSGVDAVYDLGGGLGVYDAAAAVDGEEFGLVEFLDLAGGEWLGEAAKVGYADAFGAEGEYGVDGAVGERGRRFCLGVGWIDGGGDGADVEIGDFVFAGRVEDAGAAVYEGADVGVWGCAAAGYDVGAGVGHVGVVGFGEGGCLGGLDSQGGVAERCDFHVGTSFGVDCGVDSIAGFGWMDG